MLKLFFFCFSFCFFVCVLVFITHTSDSPFHHTFFLKCSFQQLAGILQSNLFEHDFSAPLSFSKILALKVEIAL